MLYSDENAYESEVLLHWSCRSISNSWIHDAEKSWEVIVIVNGSDEKLWFVIVNGIDEKWKVCIFLVRWVEIQFDKNSLKSIDSLHRILWRSTKPPPTRRTDETFLNKVDEYCENVGTMDSMIFSALTGHIWTRNGYSLIALSSQEISNLQCTSGVMIVNNCASFGDLINVWYELIVLKMTSKIKDGQSITFASVHLCLRFVSTVSPSLTFVSYCTSNSMA